MYIKEFNVIYTEKKTDEYRLYICKKSLENQLYRIFELADRNKITEYIKYFNSLRQSGGLTLYAEENFHIW